MSVRRGLGRLMRGAPHRRERDDLRRLEERMEHLEALVEGLQDAVHRRSVQHDEQLAEIERRTHPEAVARALSEDARRRGL
jgi:hypothetical protein